MKSTINQTRGLFLLSVLSVWLLTACVPAFYTRSQKPPPRQCCELLSYHETLRVMSIEELNHELAALRVNLNYAETHCDQLRLAMLLGMPEFRFDNDAEAKQLIIVFLNKDEAPATRDVQMAQLLMDEIQWRNQIQSDQQALKKQLEEEQAISTGLSEQLENAQSKLNQLKNIDKNINAREREIGTPSTDKIPHESK